MFVQWNQFANLHNRKFQLFPIWLEILKFTNIVLLVVYYQFVSCLTIPIFNEIILLIYKKKGSNMLHNWKGCTRTWVLLYMLAAFNLVQIHILCSPVIFRAILIDFLWSWLPLATGPIFSFSLLSSLSSIRCLILISWMNGLSFLRKNPNRCFHLSNNRY